MIDALIAIGTTFALAYVAPVDVPRFEREGWYVTGQDPRYGSVVMRRDTHADAPERSVRLGQGVG